MPRSARRPDAQARVCHRAQARHGRATVTRPLSSGCVRRRVGDDNEAGAIVAGQIAAVLGQGRHVKHGSRGLGPYVTIEAQGLPSSSTWRSEPTPTAATSGTSLLGGGQRRDVGALRQGAGGRLGTGPTTSWSISCGDAVMRSAASCRLGGPSGPAWSLLVKRKEAGDRSFGRSQSRTSSRSLPVVRRCSRSSWAWAAASRV